MCAKPTLDQRRSQILSAALKTFAASGYVAARIPDIAGAAGISQGLLYRYFPSKEELFNELIGSAFARMNEATRTLELLPLPPAKKICLALRKLLDSIATSEDFSMYFLLIAQASVCDAIPEKAKAIIREQRLEPYIIIGRIMRAGQREGTIKPLDPDILALLFWTTIKGLAHHAAVHGSSFSAPPLEALLPLFFPPDFVPIMD